MAASKKKAAKKAAKKATKKAAKKPAKKAKSAKKKAAAKPAKKKAAARPAKKKAAAAKKATPKKAAAKKAAAKKEAKKSTKAAAKPAKKAAAKAEAKPAKKAAAKAETKPAKKARTKKSEAAPAKKARPRKPIVPVGPRHPKLGYKWSCFNCAAKFYDLGKDEPICPKCAADQRDRPPEEPKQASETPKPKVVRPMAQLLDDEEPTPSPEDDIERTEAAAPGGEMFDDSESDAAGLDLEDDDTAAGITPPEIDEL